MSKKVTIPTDGGNPFVVILGGVKYVYKPGETVEVPDGVALEIEEWERWKDKYHGAVQPPFSVGEGGGGADWSQNDPNAPDYVKNRTHWVEDAVVFDGEVTTSDLGGIIGNTTAISIPISAGDNYTVVFNGVTYECEAKVAVEMGSMVYLGDPYFFTMVGTPAIPFVYANGMFATKNAGTFAVTIKGKRYHPMNGEYLPDATEVTKGAVRFGLGEEAAARIIRFRFDVTREQLERYLELRKNNGVILYCVNDVVCSVRNGLEMETGVVMQLACPEPSLVVAKVDKNGNFTIDREYNTNPNYVRSPSGKLFRIKVDDDGTISATEH